MKMCTLIPKICCYYQLALHYAITTSVQMAAPVSEIVDQSFNYVHVETNPLPN
jgi:hypothetical protein